MYRLIFGRKSWHTYLQIFTNFSQQSVHVQINFPMQKLIHVLTDFSQKSVQHVRIKAHTHDACMLVSESRCKHAGTLICIEWSINDASLINASRRRFSLFF